RVDFLSMEKLIVGHDIVGMGTSAGGVSTLLYLVKRLPPGFPAAILITIHLSEEFGSSLARILSNAGPLPDSFPSDCDRFQPGKVYLAPPGRHLLAEDGHLTLGRGPLENCVRPSIDPMMRSIAVCCGPRAIGVMLTGTLGDGAAGLQAIRQCGGIAV